MPLKTVGVKLDDEIRAKVLDACKSKSCNMSTYLKNLIDKDLAWPIESNRARLKIEGNKMFIPCIRCGGPVSFNLRDIGLDRI